MTFPHASIRHIATTTFCLLAVVVMGESTPSAPTLTLERNPWDLGGSAGLDLSSKQLTYGLIDNPHAILTPSATLSLTHESGFAIEVGVEAIFDTTNYGAKEGGYGNRCGKYQELAPGITLSHIWQTEEQLGSSLETALNYTYEYHPAACKKPDAGWSNPNTQWLNAEISAPDFWLVPTLTLEYQLMRQGEKGLEDGEGGLYATVSLSHAFSLDTAFGLSEGCLTLTPTLGLGMANCERNHCDFGADERFMLRDGFGLLELAYTPVDGLEIIPYVSFHQQLDSVGREVSGDDDFVLFGGLSLRYGF